MSLEIRAVRPAEHDAVGRLVLDAYDALGSVTPAYRERIAATAERIGAGSEVLVALRDGELVGTVTVAAAGSDQFEHPGHGDGGFRMLGVSPAAQGSGVGRALLEHVLDLARARGWRRLAITSMEWMPTAHGMYRRAGFDRRADLDVRFGSGVGCCFTFDLTPDAAAHFPAPGPVPDEPPAFVPTERAPTGC